MSFSLFVFFKLHMSKSGEVTRLETKRCACHILKYIYIPYFKSKKFSKMFNIGRMRNSFLLQEHENSQNWDFLTYYIKIEILKLKIWRSNETREKALHHLKVNTYTLVRKNKFSKKFNIGKMRNFLRHDVNFATF